MLLLANHKEKEVYVGFQKIKIGRGQFVTSRRSLHEVSGVSTAKIERIIHSMKTEHQIEQQSFSKFRLITILNYEQYQANEQENEQEVDSKRTASEQQVNTNKNDKKEKKEKEYKKFNPPSLEEVKEYFQLKGYTQESAKKAFEFYDVAEWVDSKGNKVKNWKQKMIAVWFKEENKSNELTDEQKKVAEEIASGRRSPETKEEKEIVENYLSSRYG